MDATDYATNRGVVVLAAAGNDGDSTISYPASNSGVIGVAATNSNDQRASFSNFNSSVDISAPGVNIVSTYIGSRYAYMDGTSMATPFASGLAALLASKNSSMSVSQIFNTMPKTFAPRKTVAKRKGGKLYRTVKIVNYRLTTINKIRIYVWHLSAPGFTSFL